MKMKSFDLINTVIYENFVVKFFCLTQNDEIFFHNFFFLLSNIIYVKYIMYMAYIDVNKNIVTWKFQAKNFANELMEIMVTTVTWFGHNLD